MDPFVPCPGERPPATPSKPEAKEPPPACYNCGCQKCLHFALGASFWPKAPAKEPSPLAQAIREFERLLAEQDALKRREDAMAAQLADARRKIISASCISPAKGRTVVMDGNCYHLAYDKADGVFITKTPVEILE